MKSIFEQRLMNIIPQLSETQIKYLHDKFIDIQFSQEPTINGEDIRGINLFPFNPIIKN